MMWSERPRFWALSRASNFAAASPLARPRQWEALIYWLSVRRPSAAKAVVVAAAAVKATAAMVRIRMGLLPLPGWLRGKTASGFMYSQINYMTDSNDYTMFMFY